MSYKKVIVNVFFIVLIIVGLFTFVIADGWTTGLNSGLEGYWGLDETSGDVGEKIKGLNGTATASIVRGSPGLIGNAYNFTAVPQQIVNLGNLSNATGALNFTYSLWFNNSGTGAGTNGYMLVMGNNLMILSLNPSSGIFAYMELNGGGSMQSPTIQYSRNNWNHLAITYNGSSLLLYINGTLNSTTADGNPLIRTNTTIRLGAEGTGTGNRYSGSLDEIGFWNRTLTAAEITTLYNGGSGISCCELGGSNETMDIRLLLPANSMQTINTTLNFTANQTTGHNLNHTNMTFYIWDNAGSIVNKTTKVITGGNGTTQTASLLNVVLSPGLYSWNAFGCGINQSQRTNCSFATSNFSFEISSSQTIASSYQLEEYETHNSTFMINISLTGGATFYAASLIYNGTAFPVDTVNDLGSSTFQLIKTIDIPGVVANTTKSFFFQVTTDTGSGFTLANSSVMLQNVSATNISNLYTGANSITYNIFDEETLLEVNASMKNVFDWYLGGGSERQNNSFNLGANISFRFGNVPRFVNFYADADIYLSNASKVGAAAFYEPRQFNFVAEKFTGNASTIQALYLLSANNGTNVVFEVKDSGLAPLEDYLVKIYRYYPSDNLYRMVESKQTDLFGQITARLVENSVRYKIEFYDTDNNLVKVVENVYVVCRNAVCSQQFIIEDDTNYFDSVNNLTNYEYSFTFNNNTNRFTFIWNDQRGQNQLHYLEVKRTLFNGSTIVCNRTTTSSSADIGSLNCNVGDSRASYEAQAFRVVGSDVRRVAVLNVKVGDLSARFGLEGLIWSVFLLFTLVLVGSYYPPVGVILYLLGVFLLGITDVVYISPAIMIAEIVIGVIFIWAFRG